MQTQLKSKKRTKYFLIVFCFLSLFSTGCQTIKELAGLEIEISDGERMGIWYRKKWFPAFTVIAKKDARKLIIKKKKEHEKEQRKKKEQVRYTRKKEQIIYTIKRKKKAKKKKTIRLVDDKKKHKRIRLFLKPGDDGEDGFLEVYFPRIAAITWHLVLEPEVSLGTKDPNQGSFQYISETVFNNIENLQGKVGVGFEW